MIDFGVAKAITPGTEGEAGLTEVGAVIGTPEYMSPEQAEPFAADIDTRADVYSLGVLLYELLTGETPLGRETIRQVPLNEVLRRVREEEPPRPSARLTTASGPAPPAASQRQADPARLARQLRGDLDWIVMKALDKDRERRYPTANGLAQDVMRYLNDEPIVARPPSALYRLRKFTRKHQVGVVSFVLCLVLLVGGLLASAWQAVRASRAETEALAQRDAAQAARLQAEQAEQRAGREAAIAREIAEFLRHDLLGQADPHKQPDRDLKLRAVLDRASRQIPGRFRDPLVEAAVRDTIGNAYLALGEHAQAEPHLRRALELRRQHLGAAEPDTLQSHNSWGELLRKSGRLTQAEETFRAGLRLAHEHWGADHDLTLTLANNLGVTLVARGRFEEAETILKDTLERRLRVLGERARHTLASMNNLAELLLERGRVDEAEKLQVRAVASAVQAFGEDAPETLALNNLLAMIYDRQGKHDLSEPLFTTVLEKRRRVLGEEHPETLGSMSNLALWHLERSRHDRAEPLFRAALAISTRKLPADHPDLLTLKNNLGPRNCWREHWRSAGAAWATSTSTPWPRPTTWPCFTWTRASSARPSPCSTGPCRFAARSSATIIPRRSSSWATCRWPPFCRRSMPGPRLCWSRQWPMTASGTRGRTRTL